MTAVVAGSSYQIIPEDDADSFRVVALDSHGVAICGAYRPKSLNDWKIFVCKTVTDVTGLPQPHKVHCCSRDDAVRWVDTIAWLYTSATAAAS